MDLRKRGCDWYLLRVIGNAESFVPAVTVLAS